jgi:hypothetical protein
MTRITWLAILVLWLCVSGLQILLESDGLSFGWEFHSSCARAHSSQTGVIEGTCTGIDGADAGALRGERQ